MLETRASTAIRDELQELVLNDLLGPAGGAEEEVAELYVRERYLVGMLAPQKRQIDAEAFEELALGGADEESASEDGSAPPAATLFPSSFGLTFAVAEDTPAIRVTAGWGWYRRVESETLANANTGKPSLVWKRSPVSAASEPIPLRPGALSPWSVSPEQPDVFVKGIIRKNQADWIITLFLVNEQAETTRLADEAWLFQPTLSVMAADGRPAFVRRSLRHDQNQMDPLTYAEERQMAMLYRQRAEFAVGHGVAVHAVPDPADTNRATRIETRMIPIFEVPTQTPPSADEMPDLTELTLDMKQLSEAPLTDLPKQLHALPQAYAHWIQRERQKIADDPTLAEFAPEADSAMNRCERACARIQEGIALLQHDAQAAEAFRFANAAMWQQRIHTLFAEQARRGDTPDMERIDLPQHRSWYPFQLAFMLLNLPGITDLSHPDRTDAAQASADLLWFPTGGGKTEAYLGLAAYTMGLRRLQGEIAGRSGESGVAVIMRYTLRLLTLQQYQRAAALICACESIRRERLQQGDPRWGVEPFRIGLWVGKRTTPNTTEQSSEALKLSHGHYAKGSHAAGSGSPAQLKHCPWCGHPIEPSRNIIVETFQKGRGRTLIYCGDPLGRCLFSQRQSPNEGLPVLLVDEEIYRRLPALLIATVDKFAQMPWKGETQMLFGQVNGYCQRHGFRSPEIEDANSHPKNDRFPSAKSAPHSPLRPPDLIIQDELHLIVGPLGTLVGLYETAVDALASWEVNGARVRPKVIASTATIRRAHEQVHRLFLRTVNIFPPQGTDVRDNFFAVQREPGEQYPGRRYVGICAPGKRVKTALIRAYAAYLAAAQFLYEKYGKAADPWMTLVGYFNSMRELGGMRRLVDDTIRSLLRDTDQRGLARRKKPNVRELTSRIGATDIPEILDLMEVVFDPQDDELRKQALKDQQPLHKPLPVDVLLATNMLSVGVDVKRLGLMVVAGQPKSTAEYIQATSRVGRSRPGMVCVVYNWARPRDLSHYERFEHYHATFHQHVEALSVTPFAPRALDRGLSAVFVALIRLAGERFNGNATAADLDRHHLFVQQAIERLTARAGQVEALNSISETVRKMLAHRLDLWLAQAQRPTGAKILGYQMTKDGLTNGLLRLPGTEPWQQFTCLTSLREVEPTVNLILDDHGLDTEVW